MAFVRSRSVVSCRDGATAIEFALLIPILFLILFGIVEFSLIMFSKSVIEGATYEGSRIGKTGFSGAEGGGSNREQYIRDKISERLGSLISQKKLTLKACGTALGGDDKACIPVDFNAGGSGQVIQYQAEYKWPIQTPGLGQLIGDKTCRGPSCITDSTTYTIKATAFVKNEKF